MALDSRFLRLGRGQDPLQTHPVVPVALDLFQGSFKGEKGAGVRQALKAGALCSHLQWEIP